MSRASAAASNSSGKKRKKTHIPSDFKRRRAKVGRRVAPANETQTKFSVGKVSVAQQDTSFAGTTTDGGALASSQGRSIPELLKGFSHPAVAPRLASCKGLLDIFRRISSPSFATVQLIPPTLLPAVGQLTFLDEDDQVRKLGRELLQLILQLLTTTFPSLLWAMAQSGLHSLDRSTRLDAARGISVLCSVAKTKANNRAPDATNMSSLLPAYAQLLMDDVAGNGSEARSDSSGGKSRKSKSSRSSKRLMVLESLLSLLRCCDDFGTNESTTDDPIVRAEDLLPCTTAVLIYNSCRGHSQSKRPSIREAYNCLDLERNPSSYQQQQTDVQSSPTTKVTASLRNVLLELLPYRDDTKLLELSSVVQCLQRLYRASGKHGVMDSKLLQHVSSLLWETIPVSNTEEINGHISEFLLEIEDDENKNKDERRKLLVDYWLGRIRTSTTAVRVLMRILLSSEHELRGETVQKQILDCFVKEYFSIDATDVDSFDSDVSERLSSPVSRTTVRMACQVVGDETASARIVCCIPHYLFAWKTDFVHDSRAALSYLMDWIKRHPAEYHEQIRTSLRRSLERLVVATKSGTSLLEIYPSNMQRQLVSIILLLDKPSIQAFRGLAVFVSRYNREMSSMTTFVLESMHTLRRSVSMDQYLTCLLLCLGKQKKKQQQHQEQTDDDWMNLIRLVIGSLLQCGSVDKVAQLLVPYWKKLLQPVLKMALTNNEDEDEKTAVQTERGAKTCLFMWARMYLRLGKVGGLLEIVPSFPTMLTDSMLGLFYMQRIGNGKKESDVRASRSLEILLRDDGSTRENVWNSLLARGIPTKTRGKESFLETILFLLQFPVPKARIHDVETHLKKKWRNGHDTSNVQRLLQKVEGELVVLQNA